MLSKDVTGTQQQNPESLTVTLTCRASKYRVSLHKFHQKGASAVWGETDIWGFKKSKVSMLAQTHTHTIFNKVRTKN